MDDSDLSILEQRVLDAHRAVEEADEEYLTRVFLVDPLRRDRQNGLGSALGLAVSQASDRLSRARAELEAGRAASEPTVGDMHEFKVRCLEFDARDDKWDLDKAKRVRLWNSRVGVDVGLEEINHAEKRLQSTLTVLRMYRGLLDMDKANEKAIKRKTELRRQLQQIDAASAEATAHQDEAMIARLARERRPIAEEFFKLLMS